MNKDIANFEIRNNKIILHLDKDVIIKPEEALDYNPVLSLSYLKKIFDKICSIYPYNEQYAEIRSYLTQDFDRFGKFIQNGEVVAFPTETVYGLGANVFSAEAVDKIFKLKNRPQENPLIVHINDVYELNKIAKDISDLSKRLIDFFWPGPLTLIFNKTDNIPPNVTAGLDTVAVRFPKNVLAYNLLKYSKVPIAAPSANISGKPSSTHHNDVLRYFGNSLPIVKGGQCKYGLESTVIDARGECPIILRQGAISIDEIKNLVGKVQLYVYEKKSKERPRSPGQAFRHYAPEAPMILVPYSKNELDVFLKQIKYYSDKKIGIICSSEYKAILSQYGFTIDLGSKNDLNVIAKNIFKSLILMDSKNVDIILCQSFDERGIGKSIMERLHRASNSQNF